MISTEPRLLVWSTAVRMPSKDVCRAEHVWILRRFMERPQSLYAGLTSPPFPKKGGTAP